MDLISFFNLSLGFGFLSLLTPCVFPLIPLTISYFSKKQKSVFESLLFTLGIILSFSLLGLLVSLFFGASGLNKLSTNPFLNLFLFFLFSFFAFNLMGVYEIYIPGSLLTKLNSVQSKSQSYQTILMSFIFTLTTFTCTMPFLGTLLVSASKGDWFYPSIGMFGFSLSFSVPFLFLSLFPKLLGTLPKSGSWLNSFKIVLGFLELAFGLKFLSNADLIWGFNIISKELFLSVWISILIAICFYLLGLYHFPHEKENSKEKSIYRILIFIFFLSFVFYFLSGLFGKNLGEWEAFFPPISSTKEIQKNEKKELIWFDSLDKAKELSKIQNKPIFIDFTGFSCTNCRWMEQNIFTLEEIQELFKEFILVKLYTDGDELVHEKNLQYEETKFGTIALPLYAGINSEEKILGQFLGMTRDREEYKKFLQKLLFDFKNGG